MKALVPPAYQKKLFKQFRKPFSQPLNLLINLTFSKDKFPAILKMGKKVPVYKKRCKTEVTIDQYLCYSNISIK